MFSYRTFTVQENIFICYSYNEKVFKNLSFLWREEAKISFSYMTLLNTSEKKLQQNCFHQLLKKPFVIFWYEPCRFLIKFDYIFLFGDKKIYFIVPLVLY